MPRGDRTGPWGEGPMTGRGAGYCGGYDRPGFMHRVFHRFGRYFGRGRGPGRGPGFGRGRGFWWREYGPGWEVTPEEEAAMLKDEAEWLREQLGQVEDAIARTEGKQKDAESE